MTTTTTTGSCGSPRNGAAIKAATTTSLIQTDAENVCVLTACGEEMAQWLGSPARR